MDYPKEGSSSLYDYSDKSIPQAGCAAIIYAVISTLTTGLAWFRAPTGPLEEVKDHFFTHGVLSIYLHSVKA